MPKISELNAITSVANTDLMMVVHDPGGSPSTNKITVNNFVTSVSSQLRGYTGSAGTVSFTANSSNWTGTAPSTVNDAIDRLAILVKTLNSGTGA